MFYFICQSVTFLIGDFNKQGDGESSRKPMFSASTKAIVWGMQTRAIQSMLDFDFVCRRTEPSVVAIIYPFTGDHKQKYYWGHKEILIPGEVFNVTSFI